MALQTLEGTWEQVTQHAGELAGMRVRILVLGPAGTRPVPAYARATPEERARAFRTWAESHRRDTPLLSDEAISRETIYLDTHG